jgi:hypothetical protein
MTHYQYGSTLIGKGQNGHLLELFLGEENTDGYGPTLSVRSFTSHVGAQIQARKGDDNSGIVLDYKSDNNPKLFVEEFFGVDTFSNILGIENHRVNSSIYFGTRNGTNEPTTKMVLLPNGTLGVGNPTSGATATSTDYSLDVSGQTNFRNRILVGGKNSDITNPQAVFAAPSGTGRALNVFGRYNGFFNTAEYGTSFVASSGSLHIGDISSGSEDFAQSINFNRQCSGQTFLGFGGTPLRKNDFFTATNINGNFTLNYEAQAGMFLKGNGSTFSAALIDPSDIGQIKASATLNFPSTGAHSSSDLTVTVTGAAIRDGVVIQPDPAAIVANSCYTAWVSATNTVTVRFNHYGSGSSDPASNVFDLTIIKR